MPDEYSDSGDPVNWLRYAKSDLALAQVLLTPDMIRGSLCFHAQQAAEKALKAILIFKNIPYPKTHNIRTLLDLLPQEIVLPHDVDEAAILTDYAVVSRYPNNIEEITEEEYLEAVKLARAVFIWAESMINSPADLEG